MRNRMIVVSCLCLVLLAFSGCPGGGISALVLGVWLFNLDDFPGYVGVALLADGTVNTFEGASQRPAGTHGVFGGQMTWEQDGASVQLTQVFPSNTFIYDATLLNSTFMTGVSFNASTPNNTTTFAAAKAPTEALMNVPT
jgi:hypothetical protein